MAKQSTLTRIVMSALLSAVILVAVYFADNQPFSLADGVSKGQLFERVRALVSPEDDRIPESYLAVNIAYDRQLAPVADEFGFPMGEIDITDRDKLIWLLQHLNGSDYRFIILDINFSDDIATPSDSLLYSLIASTPRLVLVKTGEGEVPEPIKTKAFFSEYATTVDNNNFSKYDYYIHGEPSLPLKVLAETEGDTFENTGLIYLQNGQIAHRTSSFPLKIKMWNQYVSDGSAFEKNWYNLGADIIDMDLELPSLVKDKIIVIGDYSENDIHDTYIGPVAGPVININAIEGARNGGLIINPWLVAILFLVYWTVGYCIFSNLALQDIVKPLGHIRNPIFRWLLSSLGVAAVLAVVSLFAWVTFDRDVDIVIPSLAFSIIIGVKDFLKNE